MQSDWLVWVSPLVLQNAMRLKAPVHHPPRCACVRMPGTERRLLRVGGGGLQCHQALRQCGGNGVVMLKILKEKNVIIIPIGHKKPLKI